jgi:predicted DNA binding CopG/RHH family protein
MKKNLPKLKSDRAAKSLLKKDLSKYFTQDNFSKIDFEFAPKSESITIRMPKELLDAVKISAEKKGLSYQKVIRLAVQRFLSIAF